jgi:hypothetical protein
MPAIRNDLIPLIAVEDHRTSAHVFTAGTSLICFSGQEAKKPSDSVKGIALFVDVFFYG